MSQPIRKPETETVAKLKESAQRLFAENGIDGVSVRDIASAADQKNPTAIGYHFGSKNGLITELVIDGAALIDQRRNQRLDQLEAGGGPTEIREIVDILIYPSIDLYEGKKPESFNRFINMLAQSHRDLFEDAIGDEWNTGFQRCLDHLRRLMPDISEQEKNQRFVFMQTYLGSAIAARERRLADEDYGDSMWSKPETLKHFARTVIAILLSE